MRTAKISRKTKETEIKIKLNIDGKGKSDVKTPIGFSLTCLKHSQSTDFLTLSWM